MGRGCWFFIALLSGFVAVAFLFSGLAAGGDSATQTDSDSALGLACCGSLLFGAFALYSLGMVSRIGKEQKKEKREQAMLNEMQLLRQQVSQQQPAPQRSEDDMQIKLAAKFWKEGKKAAAIEILEAMPHNAHAQSILRKLRAAKEG